METPFIYKKKGECSECKAMVEAVLHLHIRQNGARGFMWVCSRCSKHNPFGGNVFIKNELVEDVIPPDTIDKLPVIMFQPYRRCAVCGARDAEEHHWAPKAIFGDAADKWPTDYLCKPCHDLWHLKVTPQLVRKAKP